MDPISNTSNSLYNFVVKDGNGIKGLVDSGLLEVPKMYIQPINERINTLDAKKCDMAPIDLSKLNGPKHEEVVNEIVRAAETLGFFQVVNHGVPLELLESLKDSVHNFFNMPTEKKIASRTKKTIYGTSFSPEKENVLEWKDQLRMVYSSDEDALQFWPTMCKASKLVGPALKKYITIYRNRDPNYLSEVSQDFYNMEAALEYLKLASKIVRDILKILISNLGVQMDESKIESLIVSKTVTMNYYPPCPNPNLTVGVRRHSDMGIITVLLQDEIGGLYVKTQDEKFVGKEEWLEIPTIPGVLVINVGDALEIISNGKYKSAEHRVLTTSTKSRVSIPLFTAPLPTQKFGPLPEVVKKDGFSIYKEVSWKDYSFNVINNAHDGKKSLDFAKI